MKRRFVFHHIVPKRYQAYNIFYRIASLAYRATPNRIHPTGKVMVRWRVHPSRICIDGITYASQRGKHSGSIVIKIPAKLQGKWLSDTAHNLAIVVGTVAHELSHVQDWQNRRRTVRKPTSNLHGTPAERDADHAEHHALRLMATHPQLRRKFDRLARKLHKRGIETRAAVKG